jgi:DNA-binding NarL/FixJ family response regulator
VTADEHLAAGQAALAGGRWVDAREAFEAACGESETADGCFGLASALWWLGESRASVERGAAAYALYRRAGDVAGAARSAVWLAITYKSNFANFPAANGWLGRAERLLAPLAPGPLHGWLWLARAYRLDDLDAAEELTGRALDVARDAGDVDLELVALAQLGLVRVGQGRSGDGFAHLDEAVAAALAGERTTLDTVVYACCDMLNACELASDLERAAQWCKVADDFAETYGCPFLYAECRIYYGSVLAATGRWDDAERELRAGLRITEDACPGLYGRALVRLAGLRIRQGRLEDADHLLARVDAALHEEAERTLSLAALLLARGDAAAARGNLEPRLAELGEHRIHAAAALDMLVDAHLAAGEVAAAAAAAGRLADLASQEPGTGALDAAAAGAAGRVALAEGDAARAAGRLQVAIARWSDAGQPFEASRARLALAGALAGDQPDVAADHARRALAAFEALGAAPDADRAAALLRGLGITPRVGAKGVGLLTDREREVLALLACGLSNPEIAARLHVSRKTASHHVSNILTKLGLRNRAEAAAFATAHLPGPE